MLDTATSFGVSRKDSRRVLSLLLRVSSRNANAELGNVARVKNRGIALGELGGMQRNFNKLQQRNKYVALGKEKERRRVCCGATKKDTHA